MRHVRNLANVGEDLQFSTWLGFLYCTCATVFVISCTQYRAVRAVLALCLQMKKRQILDEVVYVSYLKPTTYEQVRRAGPFKRSVYIYVQGDALP